MIQNVRQALFWCAVTVVAVPRIVRDIRDSLREAKWLA